MSTQATTKQPRGSNWKAFKNVKGELDNGVSYKESVGVKKNIKAKLNVHIAT